MSKLFKSVNASNFLHVRRFCQQTLEQRLQKIEEKVDKSAAECHIMKHMHRIFTDLNNNALSSQHKNVEFVQNSMLEYFTASNKKFESLEEKIVSLQKQKTVLSFLHSYGIGFFGGIGIFLGFHFSNKYIKPIMKS
jgi:biopolymer transport protein ExbB/TolQ